MIREKDFIIRHEAQWQQLEHFLSQPKAERDSEMARQFPQRYRHLCDQLALAEASGYSAALGARLNRLAVMGHQQLYGKSGYNQETVGRFVLYALPMAVRRQWRYIALATAFFLVPLIAGLVLGLLDFDLAAQVGGAYESMYAPDPEARIGEGRGAGNDVAAWGFYIFNNTSIGLRTIASGALAGIGVILMLAYNGWHFGLVSAHMIHLDYAQVTFFPFVVTHAAFELTAIVFAGATGLGLARGLFFPGRQRRGDALRTILADFFPILMVTVVFFFIAAAIEAFWSAIWMPPWMKYSSGALAWTLVLGYFLWAGRGYEATDD